MASVHPFRALRYSPQPGSNLSEVLAPPYDVIDPQQQERLYRASPYNVVRLILGKHGPQDTPADNRYTRSRRDFDAWCERGILQRDAAPALYLVEHAFQASGAVRTRLGFIGLLGLQDAVERIVYRHEVTLAAPKEDRTKLLQALPANLCPIFCVYPDAGRRVQALLERTSRETEPVGRATLGGDALRLWAITAPALIDEVARCLAPVTMLIADGHHRFEVAYAHRARYGALMSYFVSMEDPGLAVRPIHRIVHHGGRHRLEALRELCTVEPAADAEAVTRWLHEAPAQQLAQGRFGCVEGDTLYQLAVKPERLSAWLASPSVAAPLAGLDVSLLHHLILPHLAGPGAPEPGSSSVEYTADAGQAIRAAGAQPGCWAWLLRGIPLEDIYALASRGHLLAPKSTYFYPKVPSGLAINPLAAGESA